ncbi:expressed unknown protein [Seminavis robusta]|uniref:Uncharacterized protein n=1 Tax=Seminavis robusta TaxID=568900 RepID=A0A9N8DM58_9STRA|nr:expressed unknown protein [Seminavis robusta]|eukprot:Sro209_g087321.1  (215) ;mRNA; r:36538-37182
MQIFEDFQVSILSRTMTCGCRTGAAIFIHIFQDFQMAVTCSMKTSHNIPGTKIVMEILEAFQMAIFSSTFACEFIPWTAIFMGKPEALQMAILSCKLACRNIPWATIFMKPSNQIQAQALLSHGNPCLRAHWTTAKFPTFPTFVKTSHCSGIRFLQISLSQCSAHETLEKVALYRSMYPCLFLDMWCQTQKIGGDSLLPKVLLLWSRNISYIAH